MTGEADLRIVADTMPAAAVRCSRDQRFLWVNARYAQWIGRAAEEIVGRSLVEIIGAKRWASFSLQSILCSRASRRNTSAFRACRGWASGG
jgi:PAS domain-containing protein